MALSERRIGTGIINAATALGAEAVRLAEDYASRLCREVTPNRGPCVDEIARSFNGRATNEPWCAKFAYVVLEAAARNIGRVHTTLPKTAGARDMLERARKAGLRVDRRPNVGAVGYRISSAPGSTGHIFIVKGYDQEYIYTVEGNTGPSQDSQGVWWAFYEWSDIERLGMYFIHAEEQLGDTLTTDNVIAGEAGFGITGWLLVAVAAGAIFMRRAS